MKMKVICGGYEVKKEVSVCAYNREVIMVNLRIEIIFVYATYIAMISLNCE